MGLLGRTEPRIGTARLAVPSHGSILGALDDAFGFELFPWQTLAAERALQFRRTPGGWRWLHPTVGLLVARQNGKTSLAARRILAGLYVLGDGSILHLAQDRALPREVFDQVATVIGDNPSLHRHLARRGGIRLTNGQEKITLTDGSTYRILAPTEDAVRGYPKVGLVFFDEVRTQTDNAVWSTVGYTQRAHPNPQRWAVSNAGHADSVVLNRLQERGRAAADDPDSDPEICWLEWSATQDMDRTDPETWRYANPALGYTIGESSLLEELRTDDPDAFDSEALCIPQVALSEQAIPWDKWALCAGDETPGERTWLAVDIDPERTWAAVVIGSWSESGRLVVGLERLWTEGADESEIADTVEALWAQHRPAKLAYDPHTGGGLVDRLPGLPWEPVQGAGWIVACGQLLDLAIQAKISHGDQTELNSQIASAGRRDVGDGTWRMSRKSSVQPIPGAIALARLAHVAIAGAGGGVGITVL